MTTPRRSCCSNIAGRKDASIAELQSAVSAAATREEKVSSHCEDEVREAVRVAAEARKAAAAAQSRREAAESQAAAAVAAASRRAEEGREEQAAELERCAAEWGRAEKTLRGEPFLALPRETDSLSRTRSAPMTTGIF